MSKSTIILIAVLGVILVGGIGTCGCYNRLATLDEDSNEAWGKVENVYQRRNDLIPNLMETCNGYMNFEKETLTGVTQARQQVTNIQLKGTEEIARNPEFQKQFFEAQQNLGSALTRLLAVSEAYPDLKASKLMTQFMDEQAGSENRVAVERGRFQETVNNYNKTMRRFPANIVAGIFGFERREYYKANEGASRTPQVEF